MLTPEERKAAALKRLTSFLREGKYLSWNIQDIQRIEAAIEAAYDIGKNSTDEPLTEALKNLHFHIANGAYGTYKKR